MWAQECWQWSQLACWWCILRHFNVDLTLAAFSRWAGVRSPAWKWPLVQLRCRVWRGDLSIQHLWGECWCYREWSCGCKTPMCWLQPPSCVLSMSRRGERMANQSDTENLTLLIQLFFSESKPSHFLWGFVSSLWSFVWFLNQNFNWKFYQVSFQSQYCFFQLQVFFLQPLENTVFLWRFWKVSQSKFWLKL